MRIHTIITIARQYGSGGREIGERVAKHFDIPFYNKDLITLAAKQSGMSPEILEKADEKATNSLLYSLMMGNYTFGSQVSPIDNLPINDKVFLAQSQVIREAAEKAKIELSSTAETNTNLPFITADASVPIMSYVKIRIACMFMSMQIILHAWTVSLNSMGSIRPKPLTRL